MRVLVLDGRLAGQDQLDLLGVPLLNALSSKGWDVESILLHTLDIRSCVGCFRCWHTTPGVCSGVGKDDAPEVTRKAIASDLLVFLTPLTFGGYSSELKRIIGRFLGLLQPGVDLINGESHHMKRYDRYPSALFLALAETADAREVEIFAHLSERHALNFYPPRHASAVISADDANVQERVSALLTEMEHAS